MKKTFHIIVLIIALCINSKMIYASQTVSQHILTLHYPPDKTVMEYGLLGISMSMPRDSADLIIVMVNNERKAGIAVSGMFACFTVPIEIGVNKIEVTAEKKGRLADTVSLMVFRRSELIGEHKDPPPGFNRNYFHAEKHPECSACHRLEPGKYDKTPAEIDPSADNSSENAEPVSSSSCYSCHRKMTSYPFVHNPAAAWKCLGCHDPEAKPVYSVDKPDTKMCFQCHSRQKEIWDKKKYFHGPFIVGKCVICHNPHASENTYELVRPLWLLCISCHSDKGSGRHIIGGYVNKKDHPTHGVPDPFNKGAELSCASCHAAHASDSPKLWAFEAENVFDLCRKCHAK
ncbi:MAG: hypothetical protein HY758_08670 [Nitrospirae bacterium]|nr:hypothetical protein [Nitrospirota bacterium]